MQFEPVVGDLSSERARNLDMLVKLEKKKPIIDLNKAVNKHIADEEKRCTCSNLQQYCIAEIKAHLRIIAHPLLGGVYDSHVSLPVLCKYYETCLNLNFLNLKEIRKHNR